MRVLVVVKASRESEGNAPRDEKMMTAMGNFNEELVNAGVMLSGEGLQPSSKAVRVRFAGDQKTVIDGPFAETKELIAGFWIWRVKSMQDAVGWLKRAPFREGDVDIRPIFEMEDFGAELTPEARAQEARLRARMAEAD